MHLLDLESSASLGDDVSAHGKEFLLQADAHTTTREGLEHTAGKEMMSVADCDRRKQNVLVTR